MFPIDGESKGKYTINGFTIDNKQYGIYNHHEVDRLYPIFNIEKIALLGMIEFDNLSTPGSTVDGA